MRRPGVVVALLIAAGGGAWGADIDVNTFGDSVTRGNSCPVFLPGDSRFARFDGEGPGCGQCSTQSQADDCALAWRLDPALDALSGLTATVRNHGKAGEETPGGKARFLSTLMGGDDVVVLMEGTNDVSQILKGETDALTPQQIANNLEDMVEIATENGLVTIIASTIRRVCPGWTGGTPCDDDARPIIWPTEENTEELKDILKNDVAPSLNRDFVDVWDSLCLTQPCTNSNYYQSDKNIGHLDQDGYDVLTALFVPPFQDDDDLPAGSTISPVGDVDASAVFTWSSLATAKLYRLIVEQPPTMEEIHREWYDANDACSGSTCSVDIGTLDAGDARWKVQGRNLRGAGADSPWANFTVYAVVPAAPTPIAPIGELVGEPPLDVEFSWSDVGNATQYQFRVDTAALPTLPDGTATGTVSVTAPGTATLSAAGTATVTAASARAGTAAGTPAGTVAGTGGAAAAGTPAGTGADTTPPVLGSIFEETHDADDICAAGTCSVVAMTALGEGDYTWEVRGMNPVGSGPFSAATAFSIVDAAPDQAPVLDYPLVDIYDTEPTFRWFAVPDADDYELQLDGAPTIFPASNCVDGVCTGQLASPIGVGPHTWRVRGRNAAGAGPWSNPVGEFEVLPCGNPPDDLELTGADTGMGPDFTTCGVLLAHDFFTVLGTEHVTLHAGDHVELGNDFSIQPGGALTVRHDE